MTLNFDIPNQPEPRNRLRAQQPDPRSLPLFKHPRWPSFIQNLGHAILDRYPEFRPQFLELLDEADLL